MAQAGMFCRNVIISCFTVTKLNLTNFKTSNKEISDEFASLCICEFLHDCKEANVKYNFERLQQ
jgi:DNA phosphorothioation-dependent restriction protein DptG